MFKVLKYAATPLLVSALASSCGSGAAEHKTSVAAPSTNSQATGQAHVNAAVVRGGVDYDFPLTPTVVDAAAKSSVIVGGEVVGWSEGRTLVESEPGGNFEDFFYTAILKVRVVETFTSDPIASQRFVYVEVDRGGTIKVDGKQPEGTLPVLTSIAELNAAVPAGTPIIVFGEPTQAANLMRTDGIITVNDDRLGLPGRSTSILANIQGLLFRDEDGAFVSGRADSEMAWGWIPAEIARNDTFDYLMKQLRANKDKFS